MRGLRGIALALVLVLVAGLAAGSARSSAAIGSSSLGVYRGAAAPDRVKAYEAWLGRSVGWAVDFVPRDSWDKIEDPGWLTSGWHGSPYHLSLTVPMLPDTGGTLEDGATGAYDAHFVALARNLVASGYGDATIRLGHEFNGGWYRWAAAGKEAAFAAYWRHVVDAMRSVPGQHFTFDWCPSAGTWGTDVAAAYPGDAYVDYVGLDVYDQDWGSGRQNPVTRWQDLVSQLYGLQWQKDFAAAHGKQMSLPEWGVVTRTDGHGGGDDPTFIQQMYAWISANNYAYTAYFEFNAPDGDHELNGPEFPNASAAFRQLFGNAPAPPTTTPPAQQQTTTTTAASPAPPPPVATPPPVAAPAPPPATITAATTTAPVTTTSSAAPTAAKTVAVSRLGVYRGGGAAKAVHGYETWLGHSVTWVLDYLPRDSWAKIEDPGWLTSAWHGTPYRLALTVPMLPDTGGTLAVGARGDYDAHFVKLAKNLVAQGYGNASLRIGHEFNGTWYRWSAAGKEAAYAAYFRRIVTAMRSVPGQHFTFDWCPNANTVGTNVEAAYPGDAYVDYIGLDAYDQDWAPGWDVPATRWHDIVDGTYGLRWQKTFAAAHHKRMTLPEWGVFTRPDGHGGGDDPLYINQMFDWIAANDYAYAIYFEFDAPDGTHALMSTRYPKAAAAFRASFGARTAAAVHTTAAVATKKTSPKKSTKRQPARSSARRVVRRTTTSATSR